MKSSDPNAHVLGDRPTPGDRPGWVDEAQERLRVLLRPELDWPLRGRIRRSLSSLLYRPVVRLLIRAQLTPGLVWGLSELPGGCGVPWQGCPQHGDRLEYAGFVHGWQCPDDECEYAVDAVHRVSHCERPAVAVLSDVDESHHLPVCAGHLHSEVDNASYGGEPVQVTYLDTPTAA